MVHLDTAEGIARRERFIGAIIAVRAAHLCGEVKVFHSPDVSDYFCEDELVFL